MASKQFSGASRASPSHGHNAKPNPLLSQLRTTSHGSGGPLDDQNSSGVAASPPDHFNQGLSSDYSTNAENYTGYSSNRIAANSKATTTKSNNNNNGLAMSQTRTTTHTSNQHNSGGNVGASSAVATPTGVVPQQT